MGNFFSLDACSRPMCMNERKKFIDDHHCIDHSMSTLYILLIIGCISYSLKNISDKISTQNDTFGLIFKGYYI